MAYLYGWLSPRSLGKAIRQESWASLQVCLGFLNHKVGGTREEMNFLMPRHGGPGISLLLHPVGQSNHRSGSNSKGGNRSSTSWGKENHVHTGRNRCLWPYSEINAMNVHRIEFLLKEITFLDQKIPPGIWHSRNIQRKQRYGSVPANSLIAALLGRQSNLPQTVFTCVFPHFHVPFSSLLLLLQAERIRKWYTLFSRHIVSPDRPLSLVAVGLPWPLWLD